MVATGEGASPRRRSRADAIALALCLLAYAVVTSRELAPFEDSFITYRYAEHLAAGQGAVWNLGEAPVEGFSSPLWTLLLVLVAWCGLPLPSVAPLLSATLGGLCVALSFWLSRRLLADVEAVHTDGQRAGWAMLAPVLLIFSGPLAYWSGTGMETSLNLLLCLWTLQIMPLRAGEIVESPRGLGLALGLLVWTRPESAVWIVAVLSGAVLARALSLRSAAWTLALLVGLGCALLGWRLAYFGVSAPNTYYAKMCGALSSRLTEGATDVVEWSLRYGGILLPALLWLGLRRGQRRWLLVWPGLFQVCAVVYMGGDMFAYHRFLLPALVVLFVALSRAAAETARARWAFVAALGVLGYVATAPYREWPASPVHRRLSPRAFTAVVAQMNAQYAEIGQYLRTRLPDGSLVAVNAAGIIPYVSALPALDLLGLNDAHIAHHGHCAARGMRGHRRYDAAYTLSRRPLIYLPGFPQLQEQPRDPRQDASLKVLPGDRALLASPELAQLYTLEAVQVGTRRWLSWFRRTDRALP